MKALRLMGIQARAAALLAMQYRAEFALQSVLALAWIPVAMLPLVLVFRGRDGVAGWSWGEALVVIGFFTTIKAVLSGVLSPSMLSVVDHVRKGTLDFLLLKPADALLLVSTSRFDFTALPQIFVGFAIASWGAREAGRTPSALDLLFTAFLLACGCLILWALWVVAVSQAFHFVKVDNLSYLINSTFDAARWPSAVYRGIFELAFTFVFPLAVMTTWPALAVLGRAGWREALLAIALTGAFLALARVTWRGALRKYTSAGG